MRGGPDEDAMSYDEGGEESTDDEDYVIQPDDLLILAARNEDDVSNLEVWLYEEASAATGRWHLERCSNPAGSHCCCLLPLLPLLLEALPSHTFRHLL